MPMLAATALSSIDYSVELSVVNTDLRMSQSKLSKNYRQKNVNSRLDDQNNFIAMVAVLKTVEHLYKNVKVDCPIDELNAKNQKEINRMLKNSDKYNDEKQSYFENKDHQYHIYYQKKLPIKDVRDRALKSIPDNQKELFSKDFINPGTHGIIPDGGLVFLEDLTDPSMDPILLLTSEMKHQGTNELRKLEGKAHQAVGNAIERCYKNIAMLKWFNSDTDIFPYLIFCWGEDFANKTIVSKMLPSTFGLKPNQNYTEAPIFVKDKKPVSLYVHDTNQPFTVEEMYDVLMDTITISLNHYFDTLK